MAVSTEHKRQMLATLEAAEQQKQLARVTPAPLVQRDELSVEDMLAQVQKIQQVMAKLMKEGEHYGVIPGTSSKPTLMKAGAEKLCLLFRLDPEYDAVSSRDGDHLDVLSTCTLYHIPTGNRMGSGMGSCSTRESKYAYRQAKRTCPSCGVEGSVNKSKYPPKGGGEPGWYCRDCKAQYEFGDPQIQQQELGRIANPDKADQYNTILKMANKRSLIAAVLNVTAASDIFTQDLEDVPAPTPEPVQAPAPMSAIPPADGERRASSVPNEGRTSGHSAPIESGENAYAPAHLDMDALKEGAVYILAWKPGDGAGKAFVTHTGQIQPADGIPVYKKAKELREWCLAGTPVKLVLKQSESSGKLYINGASEWLPF